MREDSRVENVRNPDIDFVGFIYKNYKEICAFILIIVCIAVLVCSKEARDSEKVSTILTSVISASLGYMFGKNVA
jgi:TctA family transporter